MSVKTIYKIIFVNQGSIYEIYAREVAQSSMLGFVEVSGFVFTDKSKLVIDPSADRLKSEFSEVSRTYIPLSAIIRIDEVEKEGVAKIVAGDGNQVINFPGTPNLPPANK